MINGRQLPELRTFAVAEKALPMRSDPALSNLVVPNGNGTAAVHRWFKYKEAFSSSLLSHLLEGAVRESGTTERLRLLDPYCGVGTSLLSAQLIGEKIESIGIECNPFSAFVARTKIAWPQMDAGKFRALAEQVGRSVTIDDVALPELSSIKSGKCITRHMSRQVVGFRRAIEALPTGVERDALILGLASVIEAVSKVRRDGRALRIIKKPRTNFRESLAKKWAAIADDIVKVKEACSNPGASQVRMGDGRRPTSVELDDGSIDMIVTSPPYPNNIDYNEVYKLELWFLGYATAAADFLALRRSTYRSHPTCSPLPSGEAKMDDAFMRIVTTGSFSDLMGLTIRRVARIEKQDRRGRAKVLLGYAYDTWRSLQAHFKVLRPGGTAIYVVGNSLHGGTQSPYLVPTDLIFATLAQIVGFKVEEVAIARSLPRRLAGNHFLRDSVVTLRKD